MDLEEESISLQQESKKDKFHIIRVPKGFDITQLNGVTYDPHQILEIEVKKDKSGLVNVFELGTFAGQNMDLNLLVKSEDKIKAGPSLSRNLFVTKTVRLDSSASQSTISSVENAPSGSVCLPEGLKERFTAFGSSHPVIHKVKSNSKKAKKRKRSLDALSPTKKRHKPTKEDDSNVKDAQVSHNYSVGDHGDATSSCFTSSQIAKNEKKSKKMKQKSGENNRLFNGFTGPDEINKKHIKDELISSVIDNSASNSIPRPHDFNPLSGNSVDLEVKTEKKIRKHLLSNAGAETAHQISDELLVKEKRRKQKKKKDKD